MSQADFTIANQTFPDTRAEINTSLQALATNSSGNSAPSTTFANQWWFDSDDNTLYMRNKDDDAWVTILTIGATSDLQTITTNLIAEATNTAGVTIDGLLIKDSAVGASGTATSLAGIPFFTADNSIYTHDVSGTDNSASSNAAYGIEAMDAITTGDENVAVGRKALTDLNTGSGNVAIGMEAAHDNTTGSQNVAVGKLAGTKISSNAVAVGYTALRNNTGSGNIGIGKEAGLANTSGTRIIAIGTEAYDNADTENDNLAIGESALGGSINGGEYNVAVGNYALSGLTTADFCTTLGYEAGKNINTGGYNTCIGYRAGKGMNSANTNVAIGTTALQSNTVGDRNVAIGAGALSTFNPGSNTDDSNTAIGYGACNEITTGVFNIGIGALALGGAVTDENRNMAIGVGSMAANVAGGEYNVCVGNNTGGSLTSADYNTLIGYAAGGSITTGGRNVIIGSNAGDALLVASSCVFIGDEAVGGGVATGSHNVAIGRNSGHDLTSASEGCFVGFEAGKDVTSSNYNTLIGMKAGESITTGDGRNTVIGLRNFTQGTALTTGNNNIALGERCKVTAAAANFQFVIGSNVTSNGNSTTTIGYDTTEIATNHGSASWAAVSDVRYKKNISDSQAGLSFINDLRPVTFKFKQKNELDKDLYGYDANSTDTDGYTDKVAHGFIAQEIKTAIDNHSEIKEGQEIWKESPEAKGKRQNVSHIGMIPMLVKAVQELSVEINKLKGE